ncbi:MAG: DNA primase [Endomicrobia bacterium]|nr:DNA primase [Endomicrobiia bacterium]MCL2506671.1 DNA primase [Endomicrobiia bacterium]
MAISDDIIERVRLSNNIESVVREYLPNLKRAGRNWQACCPFHNEKTPSFMISPEKGIFKCFGCSAAGDVFKFVMMMDNLSWIESVKKLAKKAGIEIQETKEDVVKVSEKAKLFEILESAAKFYHRHLLESESAKNAREYLSKRGITAETIRKFQLGYAPKNQLLQSALKKGYTTEILSKAGIITKTERGTFYEYMSERLVFPIFDVQGRVVAFGGRTLTEQQPKYLNTPETAVYSKSFNLYGLFQTLPELRKERKIIVLEGYVDVVIPQQFGITGAVASLGTAFTHNHAKLIARYADSVKLLFDSDEAGRTATQRALEILIEDSVECSVSTLPEDTDADEYLNKHGKDKFLKLLEDTSETAESFMIKRVSSLVKGNTSEAKAKKVFLLLDFVLKSSNAIVRGEWIKKISQNFNLNEETVWKEFKKKQASNLKSYGSDNKTAAADVINESGRSPSLEESLLNLILTDREYVSKVPSDCFKDSKCAKVYGLAATGLNDADILNSLAKNEAEWFSSLVLKQIEYKNIGEAFKTVLKDVEKSRLESRRKELTELIKAGKAKQDEILEFNRLNKKLKGSEK